MTPEQLLSIGAHQTKFGQSPAYAMPRYDDMSLEVEFNHWVRVMVRLGVVGAFSVHLPHIKTFEQFKQLYTLLTGREVSNEQDS